MASSKHGGNMMAVDPFVLLAQCSSIIGPRLPSLSQAQASCKAQLPNRVKGKEIRCKSAGGTQWAYHQLSRGHAWSDRLWGKQAVKPASTSTNTIDLYKLKQSDTYKVLLIGSAVTGTASDHPLQLLAVVCFWLCRADMSSIIPSKMRLSTKQQNPEISDDLRVSGLLLSITMSSVCT